MNLYINLTGTWTGYYTYGREYGEKLNGEKVKFMLFLTQRNFKFEGTSVDYEGIGADFDKASINGFIKGNFISFIKQYPVSLEIDEHCNLIRDDSKVPPEIHYEGYYDEKTNLFSGKWELVVEIKSDPLGDTEYLNTGTWEMRKDE